MSLLIELCNVGLQLHSDVIILSHNPVVFFSIAPQLVVLPGMKIAASKVTIIQRRNVVGAAVSMHPEDSRKYRKFVPADQKLLKIRIVHIIGHKAADVRRPPRNSRKSDVQPRLQLILQCLKGARHIAGPENISVFLASRPAASKQIDHRRLLKLRHRIIENPAVPLRILAAALQRRSIDVTVVVKIIGAVIRFRIVQPECINAKVIIVLFAFLPDIFSGFRIENVDLHAVPLVVIGLLRTALRRNQKSPVHHLREVLALSVHRRPDGDNNLDAHRMKLIHHRLRIRPVGFVKLPVSLKRPVEEVDDNHIDRKALFLVFPCNRQNLLLRAVAKLALPQSHEIFRKHGRTSGYRRIFFQDFLRRISCRNPVIHLPGCRCLPLCIVLSKGDTTNCRIIPEEPIAHGRNFKRYCNLRVSLLQTQNTALQIQIGLLILAHSVNLLLINALKANIQREISAWDSLPLTAPDFKAAALLPEGAVIEAEIFAKELLPILIKGNDAGKIDRGRDPSVGDPRKLLLIDRAITDPVILLCNFHSGFGAP